MAWVTKDTESMLPQLTVPATYLRLLEHNYGCELIYGYLVLKGSTTAWQEVFCCSTLPVQVKTTTDIIMAFVKSYTTSIYLKSKENYEILQNKKNNSSIKKKISNRK